MNEYRVTIGAMNILAPDQQLMQVNPARAKELFSLQHNAHWNVVTEQTLLLEAMLGELSPRVEKDSLMEQAREKVANSLSGLDKFLNSGFAKFGARVGLGFGAAFGLAACGAIDYNPPPLPNGAIPGYTPVAGEQASVVAASAAAQAEGRPDPTFFGNKPFTTEEGFLASFQEPNIALAARKDFHIDPTKVDKSQVDCFGTYQHCHPGAKAGDVDYMASMIPGTNRWGYFKTTVVEGTAGPGEISLEDIVGRIKQGDNEMEERGECNNPKPVKPVPPIIVPPSAPEATPTATAVATKPAIIIPAAQQPESPGAVAIANNTNNITINSASPTPTPTPVQTFPSPTPPCAETGVCTTPTRLPTGTPIHSTPTPRTNFPSPTPANAETSSNLPSSQVTRLAVATPINAAPTPRSSTASAPTAASAAASSSHFAQPTAAH